MRVLNVLKPEYVYRPRQAFVRLWRSVRPIPQGQVRVGLPWGTAIAIRPSETIGRTIWNLGVYELATTELLWRLTDPSERAIDVGANIGYITMVLAARVTPTGRVDAFEPHPLVSEELRLNTIGFDSVHVHGEACTDISGEGVLLIPEEFEGNRGLARLAHEGSAERGCSVPQTRLDEALQECPQVMKIDVEGGELRVLRGAGDWVGPGGIRDIVFEDYGAALTPTMRWLSERSYMIFRVSKGIHKVDLLPLGRPDPRSDGPPTYFATLKPERARERLAPRGWRCLRGG